MHTIKVLHLFDCYLPETENWAYRLLKHIPHATTAIAAIRFNGKFQDPAFTFHRFPINPIQYATTLWGKVLIRTFIKPLYPYVLARSIPHPDILHAHFANTGYFFLKLKKLFHCPLVISYYGFDYAALPASDERWKERYRKLFLEADLFLCEGPAGAHLLRMQGCPPEKIGISRIGVDVQRIPFFQRAKKPQQLRLLQIATFRKKKGQCDTIAAFATALQECPSMHLTLVGKNSGDGTYETMLAEVDRRGISNHITIREHIDYADLHPFMKDFDVFIQPSFFTDGRDCEGGAPIVLLDAQATGMPVIATHHCDIPEEVIHGRTGFLAPENDILKISEYIKTFYYMDGTTYASYSKEARAHVARAFDAQTCGAKLRGWYEKLLHP